MSPYTLIFGLVLLLSLLSPSTQYYVTDKPDADPDADEKYVYDKFIRNEAQPMNHSYNANCKNRRLGQNSQDVVQLEIKVSTQERQIRKLQQQIISYEIRDKLAGLPMVTVGRKDFYVIPELKLWHEARTHCRNLGLDLASVETQEENNAISSYIKQGYDAWLGGTDAAEEGTWTWLGSGRNFNYNAWGSKEYAGYPKKDTTISCMYMWYKDGRWYNDRKCNEGRAMAFVCQ